jgi:hypothetical protein
MATITSAASGNWSATATWVGGVVPTAADDVVIANTHIVVADVNITVLTISRPSTSNGYVNVTSTRTITCTNGISCASNVAANGLIYINTSAPNTVTINSNLTKSNGNGTGSALSTNGTGIVTINGNISDTSSFSYTVHLLFASSNVTIVGNITSNGSQVSFPAVLVQGNGSVLNVTGNVSAGTVAPAIINTTSGPIATVTVNGTVTATALLPAINNFCVVGGVLINFASRMAVNSATMQLSSVTPTQWLFQTNNALLNKTLYDVNTLPTVPIAANVRQGVSYANGALTGTLIVPTADTVTKGVIYDYGIAGTAENTAASFLANLAVSTDPLAERLRNVSTVQTTSAQIAAAI